MWCNVKWGLDQPVHRCQSRALAVLAYQQSLSAGQRRLQSVCGLPITLQITLHHCKRKQNVYHLLARQICAAMSHKSWTERLRSVGANALVEPSSWQFTHTCSTTSGIQSWIETESTLWRRFNVDSVSILRCAPIVYLAEPSDKRSSVMRD